MKKDKDKTTEKVILQAAREAFLKKGLAGARMQDIANEAGINKALVHYYFDTKEKLFALVFEEEFGKFFFSLASVLMADIPLFSKIEQIVQLDLERLGHFPDMPLFIVNEVSRNPAMLSRRLKNLHVEEVMAAFRKQVNAEARKGNIKKISAEQLLINIQALSIFPFIGRPMLKGLLKIKEADFKAMMELRKKELARFIIDGIRK